MTTRRLTVLLLAAGLAACGGDDGRAAPDFSLAALSGPPAALSAQKGRVVLLNFWATWCDSCRQELPALEELSRRRDASRFVILAVSVDEDAAKVPPFVKAHGLTFPVLYADPKTMNAYRVRGLPTSFLIAPDGTIERRYVGPLDPAAVENDIVSLLNRRPS